MNDGPRYVTFRDYLRVVRERRVLVVVFVVLFTAGAVGYSVQQDPVYSTDASVEFRGDQDTIFNRSTSQGQTPEQRAAINAQTITRTEVAERAKEILKAKAPIAALQRGVRARAEARTNLVVVEGRAVTAKGAASLANAFSQAAKEIERDRGRADYARAADAQRAVLKDLKKEKGAQFQRILVRQRIAEYDELSRLADPVVIRRQASAPSSPIRPRPVQNTLLGLLMGITFGLLAAFVRDSLDRRFKSSKEITEDLHLPLLGYVREDVLGHALIGGNGRKTLTEDELEGFRILRTNIEFLDVDHPPKLILVTSALPEEGKSTVSSALAAAYASAGKRTLLVECDLRRPTLAARLGVNASPGLTDYLVGNATPPEVIQTISFTAASGNGKKAAGMTTPVPLVAITAGTPAPQPAELLRSKRCRDFFEQVKGVYDVVIVDTCPLLSVVDTLELLPVADAIAVCVRASQTTRDQARAAKAALAHFPDRPTGIVVTGVRTREEAGQYGYYSYGYVYKSS
jgi:capsular exopolysaccharide synthesis family protein